MVAIGQPFGIAFAGAGMVSELHARALEVLPEAQLVGLYEPQAELAEQRAHRWHCRAYPDLESLVADPEVNGVLVLSPFETHEEVALRALKAGKHVFVEKPVASIDGIERLNAAAATHDLICMPGHNYAYQPEFQQLRRLTKDGSLGTIRAVWITYAIKHPEEIAARYAGVLEEVMIHHVYLTLSLLGKPARLYAGRAPTSWERLKQDDQAWMTWEYNHGATAHLFASFAIDDDTSDSWMFVVKVLGTNGGATYSWRTAIFDRPLGTLSRAIPAYEDSYIHEDRAFVQAARGDSSVIVSTLEDAGLAAKLLTAADSANRSRAGIAVSNYN